MGSLDRNLVASDTSFLATTAVNIIIKRLVFDVFKLMRLPGDWKRHVTAYNKINIGVITRCMIICVNIIVIVITFCSLALGAVHKRL